MAIFGKAAKMSTDNTHTMNLGVFLKVFASRAWPDILDAVRAHGLRWIHFTLQALVGESLPRTISSTIVSEARNDLEKRGLRIASFSGTFNMAHPDADYRQEYLKRFATACQACRDLGGSTVALCTGTRDPYDMWRGHPENKSPQAWMIMRDTVAAALEIADRYNLILAFEPEINNVVDSAEKARRLLDELQHPRLKVILDPVNLWDEPSFDRRNVILETAVQLLGRDIVVAHAKDVLTYAGPRSPGDSPTIDYANYLRQLRGIGFAGPLLIHSVPEDKVPAIIKFLREMAQQVGIHLE